MAGGKETPRQKMIGMMYLVLTALLAMNISKDVLNAFIQINKGLGKTNTILEQKAQATIDAINNSKEAQKAKPFQDKAAEVDKMTDDIMAFMEEMKARIIASSANGNKDGAGFEEFMVDGKAVQADMKRDDGSPYVKAPDENQNNTSLLIGPKPESPRQDPFSAYDLRTRLEKFRDDLLAIKVTKADSSGKSFELPDDVKSAIENAFKFEPGLDADGKEELWETNNFFHMPLVAVLANMSKLQTDVMNTKNNVINALASGINATDLKFTDVTVAVVPKTGYVLKGDEFEAEIYLAAFNKTSQTKVYMGGEFMGEDPGAAFDVAGKTALLSEGDGKVRFKVNTGGMSLGDHGYRGQIAYEKDGVETYIPFIVPPFYVGEPALVVSPVQMNVFYRGLENPVEISVPGVGPEKIKPTCEGCAQFRKGEKGQWIVEPGQGNEAKISVSAEVNGQPKNMGVKNFRIKKIPDPVPSFAGKKPYDSTIQKGDAANAQGVRADMENFDFNVTPKVISFKITITSQGSFKEFPVQGREIPANVKENIGKARTGEKIFIEEIMVDMPDGTKRKISPITLKII
ncbi:MAG: gliding motility protein GldM [Flavobacteriales bacterium]